MSNYLREKAYIRLIQCFLLPRLMLQHMESPDATPDGHVDPLYQLFVPKEPEDLGIIARWQVFGIARFEIITFSQINLSLTFDTLWLTW